MRVFLYFIGKPKDPNLNAAAEEYLKRCRIYSRIEAREIRPDRIDPWLKHPAATKILLDPAGKQMDSAAFAALVGKAEQESRDLVFLIGGHDGAPPGWKQKPGLVLSLSAMTWPHELARVMLAEQIYRAFAILRGHPYPR